MKQVRFEETIKVHPLTLLRNKNVLYFALKPHKENIKYTEKQTNIDKSVYLRDKVNQT